MSASAGAAAAGPGSASPASTEPALAGPARSAFRRLPAWSLTAAFGLAYVIVAPLSTDLAAAGYRSDLFSRAGLTLWDNGWYGGHHLPAYSLLAPPLSALLSPQLLAALAMTVAAAIFARLIAGRFTPGAERLAALWFAAGAAVGLLSNRVPFELGVALALGALLAAQSTRARAGSRRRGGLFALALTLAALCALASPLAAAFLALAAIAWAIGGGGGLGDARLPLALALTALLPVAVLAVAFPEGGSEPFAASAFYPTLGLVLLVGLALPAERRLLRIGTALYALVLIGAYVIPSPVGGNADRLGALLAGPLLVCTLPAPGRQRRGWVRPGRGWALLVLLVLLGYWQLRAPIADYVSAASDPAAAESYYRPLLAELGRLGIGYGARPARIEVVPTRNRAEARWVADRVAMARGWERQLDTHDDGVFFRHGTLTAASYRAWLLGNAVSYVALPDAPLDYSARAEARLVRAGAAPLREVWRSRHWRLFAVQGRTPLAQRPAVLERLGADSFTLRAPAAGSYLVRVRFTPYWAVQQGHGCVSREPDGRTAVRLDAPGELRVGIDFSLARVFEHGPRCR